MVVPPKTPHEAMNRKIATFVVLDLETSNLPANNFNKAGITELCMIAFSAKELIREKKRMTPVEEFNNIGALPRLPRVLHKLTLMLNPRMSIEPSAERVTGLDNFMLEHEHAFDENAGNTIVSFLQHLQSPICLVAHNGWSFDFPLVKQKLNKLNMQLAAGALCVDSLFAFILIDEERLTRSPKRTLTNNSTIPDVDNDTGCLENSTVATTLDDALTQCTQLDWRAKNESTPKRSFSYLNNTTKERIINEKKLKLDESMAEVNVVTSPAEPKASQPIMSRRKLFEDNIDQSSCNSTKPSTPTVNSRINIPKGRYKLGKIYSRIFGRPPVNAHFAEADVLALTRLMLHYGEEFLVHAEETARLFEDVGRIGVEIPYRK